MLNGLQGAGKTTLAAKLRALRKKRQAPTAGCRRCLSAGCDQQLESLAAAEYPGFIPRGAPRPARPILLAMRSSGA